MAAWDPIYVPTVTFYGGVYGDDPGRPDAPAGLPVSTANCTTDFRLSNPAAYSPRSQNDKLQMGNRGSIVQNPPGANTLTPAVPALDVTTPRGSISPKEAYPISGAPADPAPVVSSISPSTAAAGALPTVVTITGTGFTPDSYVVTGGQGGPAQSGKYLSATSMQVTIQAGTVAGTVSIGVVDHSVLSNTDKVFTVT